MINKEKIKSAVKMYFEGIGENPDREGLIETPDRIARMSEELFNIETKALKNKSIHRTALYSYVEQKRIMMWRLQYLNEYEHLNIPDLKQKAQLVEAKSEMLLNLGLKYNILQNQHIIQRVKTLIEWINKSEVELINSVLFALDDKYGQLEC